MLERKKLELERMKVECGRMEMEYKVAEAYEQIKRLEQNMENQSKRIAEIDQLLSELQ